MSKRIKPNYQRIWAETGDSTKPVDSYIQGGWLAVKPPRQYMNWIQNRQDSMLAYLNQAGIPEWEVNTDYEANFSYVQGSDNKVYKCLANNGPSFVGATSKDPVNPLNSAFWEEAFATKAALTTALADISTLQTQMTNGSGASSPAAWRTALSVDSSAQVDAKIVAAADGPKALALFTASTGATVRSSGISSIVRNSAGQYTVIFSTAITNPIISLEINLVADPGGFALGDGGYRVVGYDTLSDTTLVIKTMTSFVDNNGACSYSLTDPIGNIHVVVY